MVARAHRDGLIVNADDWGRNHATTTAIQECVAIGSVTSVSAMVYMQDAERAAAIARRERIDTGTDVRYAKRDAAGQWKEMDDVGRSQRTDRSKAAKRTVASGYGDQGDQARRTKKAAKKR